MLVEIHDHLNRPIRVIATRVLVLDDFGNPVSFSVSPQPGHVTTFHIGDEDFFSQLQDHGINKTVIVKTLKKPEGR